MEELGKLFGSPARVKILRLFLFNPGDAYDGRDVAQRAQVQLHIAQRELALLERIKLIKKRTFYKDVEKKGGHTKTRKKKTRGFVLNERFTHLSALQIFFLNTTPIKEKDIERRLSKAGNLKLIATAGVFAHDPNGRVDLLIVGDRIKQGTLEKEIRGIESEIGKELRYAVFSTNDFKYRLTVYDRLVRDILDYPHHIVVDRIGVA